MTTKYPPSHLLKPEAKKPDTTMKDFINKIIAYEEGSMDDADVIPFFQELIDSGFAWRLQGHYERTARSLLGAGLCTRK